MYTLDEILSHITTTYEVVGHRGATATAICSMFDPVERGLTWLRAVGPEAAEIVETTPAAIIICHPLTDLPGVPDSKALVFVANPQRAFMEVLKGLTEWRRVVPAGIHSTSIVSPEAQIGTDVSVGPFALIGACRIGNNTVIKGHVVIHDGAEIGARVLVSEFCNIGGEGFGHIRDDQGRLENMPHVGKVIIEDDVELFPFSNIDRATLGVTRIGRGTKIDHFCHIGHNSTIGQDCVIMANTTTAGGATIGDRCAIGAGTMVRDRAKVGDGVMTGMASVVTKDIPDGETWVGSPAMELSKFRVYQKSRSGSSS